MEAVQARAFSARRLVAGPVSARLKTRFDAITAGQDAAFAHWLTAVNES